MSEPGAEVQKVEPEITTEKALDFLRSPKFANQFTKGTGEDRADILSVLNEVINNTRRINSNIKERARAELLNALGNIDRQAAGQKPQEEIARVFRKDKVIDFGNADLAALDRTAPSKFTNLIKVYRDHIAQFGQESIAHLCLDGATFLDLTEGISKVSYDKGEQYKVNTVGELREFIDRMEHSSFPWLRRDPEHVERLRELGFVDQFFHRDVSRSALMKRLKSKVSTWDHIGQRTDEQS